MEKIVTEMAHKLVYIETQLRDIKKESLLKEITISQPNPVTGDRNTKVTADIKAQKDIVEESNVTKESKEKSESDKEESFLECKLGDYKCKKDTTLKKHTNTRHQEYNCKVCDKKVSNLIELLQHTAKEHSEADQIEIRDIKLQDHKKALKENNVGKHIEDGEFRCAKCERIVSINDTLDKNI